MDSVFCPNCPPIFRCGIRVGPRLDIYECNYSGCGEDHATCEQCKKVFAISYKVNEVTLLPEEFQVGDEDEE